MREPRVNHAICINLMDVELGHRRPLFWRTAGTFDHRPEVDLIRGFRNRFSNIASRFGYRVSSAIRRTFGGGF